MSTASESALVELHKVIEELRNQVRLRRDCKFVSRDEYCSLIVSTSSLDRIFYDSAQLVGLRERVSGLQYLIPSENLMADV